MATLTDWATDWHIPPEALADLRHRLLHADTDVITSANLSSEAGAQAAVRLEASRLGLRLWRNNVGVLADDRGVPVRFGLANDSAAVNKRIKSGDLIGIRPVLVTSAHIGLTIGQFVSREMKKPGWRYHPNDARESAQMRWAELVCSLGGDAGFATGEGTL